jgi:large subunit ribosomal protein L19
MMLKAGMNLPKYIAANAMRQNCAESTAFFRNFSTTSTNRSVELSSSQSPVPDAEMPFLHFRPQTLLDKSPHKKFISPRKRANKMMTEITKEAIAKAHKPQVHDVEFRVGDAIEITMVSQGGVNSNETEKIRGVVLGIDRGGLGTGVYLRDVVFGDPVDRKIPLYSPMVKNVKVLEKNFVFKGKRKVKRAKLFYLRDRLPQETRVTKY